MFIRPQTIKGANEHDCLTDALVTLRIMTQFNIVFARTESEVRHGWFFHCSRSHSFHLLLDLRNALFTIDPKYPDAM